MAMTTTMTTTMFIKRLVFRTLTIATLGCSALLLTPCAAFAQGLNVEDLRIYGYMQTLFFNERQVTSFTLPNGTEQRSDNQRTSFSLQQMNIFLNKPLGEQFNAFVNMEYTLSYASQRDWGTFSIEEAWVNYYHSDALNVKAGLLLPTFNNLNELKNRTPLLPYLFRPTVYESTLQQVFSLEDYIPERAFLQIFGFVPISSVFRLDYAAHVGNSETSYTGTNSQVGAAGGGGQTRSSGEDTSPFKAFGGRVGVRNAAETLKFGISGTYDRDNRKDTTYSFLGRNAGGGGPMMPPVGGGGGGLVTAESIPPLGDVPRVRLGADLSFSLGNFAFEAEYIGVFHDAQYPGTFKGTLNKQFYYANALYNITDRLYAYLNYNRTTRETTSPTSLEAGGFDIYGGGAGYRFADWLLLKAQYSRIQLPPSSTFSFSITYLYLGLSVIF
jgi:hypothetical protein